MENAKEKKCIKGDGECISEEMINSHLAQLGIYSWGSDIREATPEEIKEVVSQTPPEILDNS